MDLNLDDFGIVLDKGEMFLKSAKEVSEYLKALPLTTEQNDRLVALMVEHVMGQDFQEYCNLFHGGNENEYKH